MSNWKIIRKFRIWQKRFKRQRQNRRIRNRLKSVNIEKTAKELEIGEMTLTDIIEELSKPGRDPREECQNQFYVVMC